MGRISAGVGHSDVFVGEHLWFGTGKRVAIEFQRTFNVQTYIGEFSAIRWAPDNSAYRYLRDCIDIFEEHGWDWSYHAFREWPGWSVEHSNDRSDPKPTAEPNDRQNLLRGWLAKNQKPVW